MAIGTGRNLSELERSWLATRVLAGPVNDMKRRYYISQVGGAAANSNDLDDLEKQWLRKLIVAGGGTPSGGYVAGLWRQAVSVLGYRVSNILTDNKSTFYRNNA